MSSTILSLRRLPVGAEVTPEGVHFRVWAPKRKKVEAATDTGSFELEAEGDGYFSGIGSGTLYKYRLDGGEAFPDPASRFQPQGPHGPSQVVDPSTFPWTDEGWRGLRREGQVLYEMHVGTFTPEGTWEAASREFQELARLGITVIEMMPIAEFPGRFGWARDVSRGRMEFLAQFPSLKSPEMRACIPDPHEPSTFEICRLDLSERESHAPCYALHRDLLRLRREDPVFRAQAAGGLDGAVLTPEAFVLRFFSQGSQGSQGDDRLLVVNLGRDLHLVPAPEPLLAPPEGACWEIVWSSEDPRYGGCGAPPPEDREGEWRLPGQAAVVLRPKERS